MNNEMKKGYHRAQVDIMFRLRDHFTGGNDPFFLASLTGLDVEEVKLLVKSRVYAKYDKVYETYAPKCKNRDELLFRLYLNWIDENYLADKFTIPVEKVHDIYALVSSGTICSVYNSLMQDSMRTDDEEAFCRDYTRGKIEGRISVIQEVYPRMKKGKLSNEEILRYLKVTDLQLKKYLSMSPQDVEKFARKMVMKNVNKETDRLMRSVDEMDF